MTDAKLDPKSLSVEERAIVDAWFAAGRSRTYEDSFRLTERDILARRAIFGGAESGGVKVECPNCGEAVYEEADHLHENPSIPVLREDYTCNPAQPEPVASVEMPEAVRCAVGTLREFSRNLAMRDGFYCARDSRVAREAADALESFWRTHSQPTPVRMTPELKRVFAAAFKRACDFHAPTGEAQQINQDIAAVRAQAAGAQVADMSMDFVTAVRCLMTRGSWPSRDDEAYKAQKVVAKWIAELDAAERGE